MAPRILMQLMAMMLALVRSLFADKANLAIENLALRQPLDRLGAGRGQMAQKCISPPLGQEVRRTSGTPSDSN